MKKLLLYLLIIVFVLFFSFVKKTEDETKTVIRFSSWGSQTETAILKKVIEEYERENINIKIDFIHIPQNYFQKIQLLFASGLEPDVVFLNNKNIQMYINANLLEDVSMIINKDSFYDEALECFSKNGKIYAVPRDISNLVIFYNKSILKNKPKFDDFSEFISFLKTLKSDKYYAINYEEDSLFWSYYLASNGGGLLSDDKKSLLINSNETIDAIKIYSDLINKYNVVPNKAQVGSKTSAQMFINGELAMYLGGRWMVPKFREVITFDWDILMFPANMNKKLYIDASGWALTKKAKNKKEALEFIEYLSSDKIIGELAQTGLIIPAKRYVAEEIIGKEQIPLNSKIFIKMLDNTKPTPVNENYSTINDIITQNVISILSGESTFEDVFDKKTITKLESLL